MSDFYSNANSKLIDASNPTPLRLDADIFGEYSMVFVKKTINWEDAMGLVQYIVGSCIDDTEAEYYPEAFDLAAKIGMLAYYADVPFPENSAEAYFVLHSSDLFDQVLNLIDERQYNSILAAAEKHIQFYRNLFTASAGKKIMEMIGEVSAMRVQAKELVDQLNSPEMVKVMTEAAEKHDVEAPVVEEPAEKVIPMKKPRGRRKKTEVTE